MMPLVNEYSIGLDLGGTNLRAAAIDRSGAILEKTSGSTQFSAGRQAVMEEMVSSISGLRAKLGAAGLAGIGIGVPGFIVFKEGVIRNSNNLPFLENFPIRQELQQRLGSFVILENDANAAALGEKWMGAGREVDDLVLLTLGTGIGGGSDFFGEGAGAGGEPNDENGSTVGAFIGYFRSFGATMAGAAGGGGTDGCMRTSVSASSKSCPLLPASAFGDSSGAVRAISAATAREPAFACIALKTRERSSHVLVCSSVCPNCAARSKTFSARSASPRRRSTSPSTR